MQRQLQALIPSSWLGQNVCNPVTYIAQLGKSFQVPDENMPQVYIDQNILQKGALGMFTPEQNAIGFPTQTIYELVAYHEFLHFLGYFRYNDALAIQREEHEIYEYRPEPKGWCTTCRSANLPTGA